MSNVKRYSPETRERAVRLVQELEAEHGSQWSAMESIAEKIGCATQTLRRWVLQAERGCTGFAERDFTLARGQLGYTVVEMSGPARAP